MKKTLVCLLAAAVAVVGQSGILFAQAGAAPAAGQEVPHRVGLIDMAEVFQGYKKFEKLRAELQAEIEKSDAEAKGMIERMQALQKEIGESNFAPGSAQYEQAEKQLLDAKGQFDSFRAATQRKLARRESEMFKVIYADTTSMVTKYAEWAKYTVVIRFDRKGIDDETPPAEAVQRMNKTVVFHRTQDDITDQVLKALNSQYEASLGAPARGATAPASNTRRQ
ncbi:MAG: OmpH family outer membrane protein [Planctomycetaceae bacterium]|nr:OmpH family outer membrane protein [Planctomycetaceae bacterium]MCA9065056.1 OmpH family outer membrane protein [Planctomycetaceae bacterium]